MRVATTAWLLVFSVLLGGCELSTDEDPAGYDGPVNSCRDNSDCPDGTACDTRLLGCVVKGKSDGRKYVVRAIPPAATRAPTQTFAVTLDANGVGHTATGPDASSDKLRLRAPIPVFIGLDARGTDGAGKKIRAKVVVTDRTSPAVAMAQGVDSYVFDLENQGLNVELLPGEKRYSFKVVPLADAALEYPPVYLDELTVTAGGALLDADDEPLELLPVHAAGTRAVGTLKRGAQPVNGITIQALDPRTGQILSTPSVTGCLPSASPGQQCGRFDIGFAEGTTEFGLRIQRPGEPSYPVTILSGLDLTAEEEGDEPDDAEPVDLGVIALDPLGTPLRYHARIERTVKLGDGLTTSDGLPRCHAIFESDNVAGGTVAISAFTNSSGALEDAQGKEGIDLYPASYWLTVLPPDPGPDANADYAVLHFAGTLDLSGTSELEGQVFTLSSRPRASGHVSVDGEYQRDILVSVEPLPDASKGARTASSMTDASGLFTIWTDPGRHRISAEAPPASGFAWGVTLFDTNQKDHWLEIPLPRPILAEITLKADEVTASGTALEWYEEVDGMPFLVGRSIVDDTGRALTLLPP